MSTTEPVYCGRKDYLARFDAKLVAFGRHHKSALLMSLRDQYEKGAKSEPFDAQKSWDDLTKYAYFYFSWQEIHQVGTMPAAMRTAELWELAKSLEQTRRLVERALHGELYGDLIKASCAEANITIEAAHQIDDRRWSNLCGLATEIKKLTWSNRSLPLDKIATALKRAGCSEDRSSKDIIANLSSASFAGTKITPEFVLAMGEPVLGSIASELANRFNSLVALERMARRAASDMRVKPGKPKGPSVLPPWDAIVGLARIYRRSTGSKPGAGRGPLSRFAYRLFVALDHRSVKEKSLVEAIKRARIRARIYAGRNGTSSPFE